MSKTIKFNLVVDNKPIRTVEDLQQNFSIEDVLKYYDNGLLQRWLQVRSYDSYLNKVKEISSDSMIDVIKQLIKIFEVELEDEKIEESIQIIKYLYERQLELSEFSEKNLKMKSLIDDYHQGYEALINSIIDNKDNFGKIKADVKEIENKYIGLFDLNYYELFHQLLEEAPLAIFAIIMNKNLRNYFLCEKDDSKEGTFKVYEKITKLILNINSYRESLGDSLKSFAGATEAYWKDIEPSNKRFMILKIQNGNYVRNSGRVGEELGYSDIKDKFIIIDGLDYKSNNSSHELLYMEV